MYFETLPSWFWVIYYLFLLTTLGSAIFCIVKKTMRSLSFLSIVFSITVPIVSMLNSIERANEANEFEHLISQLQLGAVWSIFTIAGYLYLVVWWILFFFKRRSKNRVIILN
ncbi:hypothetical protein [Litchfieldia salsa]|uniref:Uncharacterized protein n=1 Tax=Litchfieldia salsa TaxID=930152 RepID=A0A1H0SW66_9BACI|nr:hypothetical protein [Litchfieldia salsa]SDP46027.1 hypothetical protein SAMN05216565_103154 [Litchfieldia salsa]